MIDLWLDDVRPAPEGWMHVKTVKDAKVILMTGLVRRASLDHDLGVCKECFSGSNQEWLETNKYKSMPNCEHFGTGYTLVCWMEETNCWPVEKPIVHSANPVGREKMLVAINRRFP